MRYSINYKMDFGIDVSQKEIDERRKGLKWASENGCDGIDYFYELKISKDSTDKEIAQFIGAENYRDAEGMNLELDDTCTYDEKRDKELEIEDIQKKKDFMEMNPHLFNKLTKKEAEMVISLIRLNTHTDKGLNKKFYETIADKLEKQFSLKFDQL